MGNSLQRMHVPNERDFNPKLNIDINDRIIIDQGAYRSKSPRRGDIVVFYPNEALKRKGFQHKFISRVIGLPNEKSEIRDGDVLVNQKLLKEGYIAKPANTQYGPITIPANTYFMLGDHRNYAYDSKHWGVIPRSNLAGKVKFIYWPPNNYGSPYTQ